jgi:NAD(P)H-flavin reductase
MSRIVKTEEVVPNVHRIEIDAPRIAKKVQPGQFVIVMADEVGERIPFTISDWDTEKGTITLYMIEAGISTMKIAKLRPGDSLYSIVGPLGKKTEIKKYGTVLLGGGCYGIGAIYPLARALKAAGNRIVTVIEGRSSFLIYNRKELAAVSDELHYSTSDGTEGTKGKVANVIEQLLEKNITVDLAYFVGCTFMMMQSSNATKPHDIKTLVALNSIMVDGTGMCGCCRVSVGGQTKFACVDGPEFDGHKVDWEELFQRKGVYMPDEILAYQYHSSAGRLGRRQNEEGNNQTDECCNNRCA